MAKSYLFMITMFVSIWRVPDPIGLVYARLTIESLLAERLAAIRCRRSPDFRANILLPVADDYVDIVRGNQFQNVLDHGLEDAAIAQRLQHHGGTAGSDSVMAGGEDYRFEGLGRMWRVGGNRWLLGNKQLSYPVRVEGWHGTQCHGSGEFHRNQFLALSVEMKKLISESTSAGTATVSAIVVWKRTRYRFRRRWTATLRLPSLRPISEASEV